MRANRRRDTGPERRISSLLHREGLRFRRDFPVTVNGVRVRPDIVFPKRRIAVFVDGCFWHCCPEHGRVPQSNADYWRPKLALNVRRDERADKSLRAAGWEVLRFWEHEDPRDAARTVVDVFARTDPKRLSCPQEPSPR